MAILEKDGNIYKLEVQLLTIISMPMRFSHHIHANVVGRNVSKIQDESFHSENIYDNRVLIPSFCCKIDPCIIAVQIEFLTCKQKNLYLPLSKFHVLIHVS